MLQIAYTAAAMELVGGTFIALCAVFFRHLAESVNNFYFLDMYHKGTSDARTYYMPFFYYVLAILAKWAFLLTHLIDALLYTNITLAAAKPTRFALLLVTCIALPIKDIIQATMFILRYQRARWRCLQTPAGIEIPHKVISTLYNAWLLAVVLIAVYNWATWQ